MSYSVNIFTINGCSHCKVLKEELSKQGIEYDEFEVNKNRKIYDEVVKLTNLDALPTVYLQDPQTLSGPIFVAGRDFNTKEEAIEKIKKYL
jgi:glutaredoxin